MSKLKSKSFTIFIIILLTTLVSIITLSFIPQDSKATKLLVVASTTFIPLDKPVKLTIKAIDDAGNVDATRNDIAELNLTSVSYDKPSAKLTAKKIQLIEGARSERSNNIWSDSLSVKLEDGLAKIKFVDPEFERIRISVEWIEGKTQLDSIEIQLYVGYRVSQIISVS